MEVHKRVAAWQHGTVVAFSNTVPSVGDETPDS
jgi:hypothetical protein